MSLYKDASLVMIPSAYKDGKLYSIRPTDGSGDFTFSRGSNLAATRVDVNGLIEKGRENVLLQSNNFSNATWIQTDITPTSGQSGYDGTNDAWELNATATNGNLVQALSFSGVNTLSFYAKQGSLQYVFILFNGGGFNGTAAIDLADGAIYNASAFIVDIKTTNVGGGWYRIEAVSNRTNSDIRIYPSNNNTGGTTASGNIYIQDAQLEAGLVATDYIETGATSVSAGILEDMPRLDYSGGASCPSLKLEPQRTNHYYQSEYFSTGSRVVIENNSTTSPEGVNNATSVIATSTYGSHEVTLSPIISIGNTNPRTFSLYAKYNGNHLILNVAGSYTAWTGCVFDLQNGVAKTPQNNGSQSVCTADIEDAGNGWYRCSVTYTPYASGGFLHLISLTDDVDATLTTWGADEYAGDDVSGIYIYGSQVEEGSYPTSYIPTYGASVTRSGESCVATSVSDLIGQEQGTLFVEAKSFVDVYPNNTYTSITNSTGSNRIIIGIASQSNQLRIVGVFGGVSNGGNNYTLSDTTNYFKVAIKYYGSTLDVFINGVKETSQSFGGFSNSVDAVRFDDGNGALPFQGNVKQRLIFPTALTDSECIALTTL